MKKLVVMLPCQFRSCNDLTIVVIQYRAATRMQAAAACAPNYTHMRAHSVQCNVNLATTWE